MHNTYIEQLKNILDVTIQLTKKLNEDYFNNTSFDALKEDNYNLYKELIGDNYNTSFANPTYCVSHFGPEEGKFLSALYAEYRGLIIYAYQGRQSVIDLYIEFFTLIQKHFTQEKPLDCNLLKDDYLQFRMGNISLLNVDKDTYLYDVNGDHANKIVKNSDLSDLRYLFKFGKYITDNEIETAKFLSEYDPEVIDELALMTAKAYINGFVVDGKDISLRTHVEIAYNIGQELITSKLIAHLEANNLVGFYTEDNSTSPNKQYDFDHKFDEGLYLNETFDKEYKSLLLAKIENMTSNYKQYSGIIYFEKFGETPFSPESKKHMYKLDDDQSQLLASLRSFCRQHLDKVMPDTETSFCIIAFPVPEIGDKFRAVFDETCKINKLDPEVYKPIQKTIIDTLDLGEFIHIKGHQGNRTDIKVAMQKIADPEKQTNYSNCGADVNIPVGEVYTSPQLKGTTGLLHIDTVFLNDFNFKELELYFEDGNIKSYNCKNFDSEEENKKFVKENLLFPHKSLPLGEFAIGTNTLAYAIAQKYDIVDILPVLIVEKMGPHFAIGDTCYSWSEDTPIFNPDGKEIMSRDNERSLLRKESIDKAYTNIHIDITLPYDSIGHISAITHAGDSIDIIREGRFTLDGTSILNAPLDNI